jgi:hypothetical protein
MIAQTIRFSQMLFLRHLGLTLLFVLFTVLYVAQAMLLPVNQNSAEHFQLSDLELRLVSLSVIIPMAIIWFVSLWGFLRLKEYVDTIKSSSDGVAFRNIAVGVLFLTLWLPLSSLAEGFAVQYYQHHPDATAMMIRLVNYANILLLFPVFFYVYKGSFQLVRLIKRPALLIPSQKITLGYIAFAALYVLLSLMDPVRHEGSAAVAVASYYLPDWLLVTTILIPRLLMWYLGIQAVRNIYLYQKAVKGALYRRALDSLAKGLGGMVFIIIVLRCFQSLGSVLIGFSLEVILLIVFVLLLIIAGSFGMIARGASRLQQLEDV